MRLSITTLLPALFSSTVLAVKYPLAQPCFDKAAGIAHCLAPAAGGSWVAYNTCACTNTGDWLVNSAKCVKKNDVANLDAIYADLKQNCMGTGVEIVFDLGQWRAAAEWK